MQQHQIERVCCLLSASQLSRYDNLLRTYRQNFGQNRVCWIPCHDFQQIDRSALIDSILPFLFQSQEKQQKVVVHCSGGVGRTGQVLAAWLVAKRGFTPEAAILTVQKTGRNPYEAAMFGVLRGELPSVGKRKFRALLKNCRQALEN